MSVLKFENLSDDLIFLIVGYLRAEDMAYLRWTCAQIVSKECISNAIVAQLNNAYCIPNLHLSPMKVFTIFAGRNLTPDVLYNFEMSAITRCLEQLSFSSSIGVKKGYYISCAWISSARKYFQFEKKTSNSLKTVAAISFAKKRTSRLLGIPPPSNNINADITCSHGQMYSEVDSLKNGAPSSTGKVVRKTKTVLCGEYWFLLRRYFSAGATFKCSKTIECALCTEQSIHCKTIQESKLESAQKQRKLSVVNEELQDLFMRRTGVPSHCVSSRVAQLQSAAYFVDEQEEIAGGHETGVMTSAAAAVDDVEGIHHHDASYAIQKHRDLGGVYLEHEHRLSWQPLTPGLYNVVPRDWLRYWRKYAKDMSLPTGCLSGVDFSELYCEKHRLLLLPPHLVEYLVGIRKNLLGGGVGGHEVSNNSGIVVEIITAQEWDAIVSLRLSDFSSVGPCFALDGHDITWNSVVCEECTH